MCGQIPYYSFHVVMNESYFWTSDPQINYNYYLVCKLIDATDQCINFFAYINSSYTKYGLCFVDATFKNTSSQRYGLALYGGVARKC
jgi:hypothetical protein